MNWKPKVKERFSQDVAARKWHNMYEHKTQNLDDEFFRLRRDFTVDYIKVNFTKVSKLCDIGCGAGPVITELLKSEFQCVGLDYSPDMLTNAKKRLEDNGLNTGVLMRGDCEALPFPNEEFDCVICLGVISYVDDYNNIINEINRILKPSGIAIITFRNHYNHILSDPVVFLKYLVKKILMRKVESYSGVGRFLKAREVKRDIRKHELKLVQEVGIGFGPFCLNYKKLFSDKTSIALNSKFSWMAKIPLMRRAQMLAADINIMICKKH